MFAGKEEKNLDKDEMVTELYQRIGELSVENGWLKIEPLSLRERRELIEPEDRWFSLRRQCGILGLPRLSWYYRPVPVSAWEMHLMRLIDEQFTLTPFYGVPKNDGGS